MATLTLAGNDDWDPHLGELHLHEARRLQLSPEAHGLNIRDTRHMERHHRAVRDHNGVRGIGFEHVFNRRGKSVGCLPGRLGAEDEPARLGEERLNGLLKLLGGGKEGHIASLVLFEPILDAQRNTERAPDDLGRLHGLGLPAAPDNIRAAVAKTSGHRLSPTPPERAEPPLGRRYVALDLRL